MSRLVIRGGVIVEPSGTTTADVAIEGGSIVEVGPHLDAADARVLDATGCYVATGFVDLATHVGQPGDEQIETVATAASGAVRGGFTAMCVMPGTGSAVDTAGAVRDMQRLAHGVACRVLIPGALTKGRKALELAEMAEMAALGVNIFGDGRTIADSGLLRRALEYAGFLGATVAVHCEDPGLAAGAVMNEGQWSSRMGVQGSPVEAERIVIERDVALCRLTGTPIHIRHVSTAAGVDTVRRAKAEGLAVTCDVTPHHLTSTEAECASFDPAWRVEPPLRTPTDLDALREGLLDGTIDAIATDHTPVAPEDKEEPFDQAPAGMLGLESALPLVLALDLPIEVLFDKLSWTPGRLAGLGNLHDGRVAPGRTADLVVVDPNHQWQISGAEMASPCRNTPYDGRVVNGRARHTIAGGIAAVVDYEETS
ncbi:MAG: dihydroorotase [Acidimicrobiales bacterium]